MILSGNDIQTLGKVFQQFWKYRKAWKLMERELLDMMNQ